VQTDLVTIMDRVARVDGAISIVRLSERQIGALARKVVWSYSDSRRHEAIVRFGDTRLRPQDARKAAVIDTGRPMHDFELKAILLLLVHAGIREGGEVYKWVTAVRWVRILIRFADYCGQRGQTSFRQLDGLPSLRLRTLMYGFLSDDQARGGLNAHQHTSAFKSARDALKHLTDYRLVERPDFGPLLDEISLVGISLHETNHRLKHSIIPTGVMKQLIAEANAYVNQAKEAISEFEEVFGQVDRAIARGTRGSVHYSLGPVVRASEMLKEHFRELQRHVYALVLAFTGMRDDEAGALETGCSGHRTENGEEIYFIRSLLSKTDDNVISLDWVANDVVHEAVTVLSRVNELYYARAELLLSRFTASLRPSVVNKMRHGLVDRRLFGMRLTPLSANFMRLTKGADSAKALSLRQYQIRVTAMDIEQLQEMECNYISVAANTGDRGKPYSVGKCFNLTAHQFRHTFAWFIIANRLGDLDDIQYQFKHLHRAKTLVYAERGFKSFGELQAVIEDFEQFANGKAIDDIVSAAVSGRVAGGGGERLARLLDSMNDGMPAPMFSEDHQPHFSSPKELVAYATRHSESIRGLANGYCTKGAACKIRNAADPSHCLYCDTYYATPKHLPYWRVIKLTCESRLQTIDAMPAQQQVQFLAFKQSLSDNLFAADKIIGRLTVQTQGQSQKGA